MLHKDICSHPDDKNPTDPQKHTVDIQTSVETKVELTAGKMTEQAYDSFGAVIDPDIPPRTVDPRLPHEERNQLLNKPCLSLHEFADKLKAAYPKDPVFGKRESTKNLQFMSGY
jgi:hypothetical protein